MIIINTHQKILNCNIFIKFSWVSMAQTGQTPYQRYSFIIMWLCAAYFLDTCKFTFQKKNLDPLSNSVYSPGQWCSGTGTHGNGVPI